MALTPRELVETFYDLVWNRADEQTARKILDAEFVFRGSLGPELRGREGFVEYLRSVHAALGNFVCVIEDLIASEDRAAAKMLFRGTHRARFFGFEATGQAVEWSGAAFFRMSEGMIAELWVLGDIDAIKRQLMPINPGESFTVRR